VRALALLGRWNRVAGLHLGAGLSCVCGGAGYAAIRPADLEEQVAGWLTGRYGGTPASVFLSAAGGLRAILRGLAAGPATLEPAVRAALLADLERIIESFEETHPGAGGGGQTPAEGPRLP